MHRDSSEARRTHPDRSDIPLDQVRDSYDAVASEYAARISGELANKPFDREFLDRLADQLRGHGRAVEFGSGSGHVAAYLHVLGVDISGLDLSPAMVEQAGRHFPSVHFEVGDMLALPYPDMALAGAVLFYSIIHFSDAQLERCFGELRRVLHPGGVAAITFHIGDEQVHRDEWWGQQVSLETRFLQPPAVMAQLRDAGLRVTEITERDPYAPEVEYQSRRAYLTVRRPG